MVVRIFSLMALALTVGCGGADTPAPQAKNTPAADSAVDPIATVAEDFLDAVLKGDTRTALEKLTPAAVAQFEATGQGFASPGSGNAVVRIGQVRKVTDEQAAVQCYLTDDQGDAEMCCLMKQVAGQWRVSGVAYDHGPGTDPTIFNFENPEASTPAAPQGAPQGYAASPAGAGPAGAGAPATRTAADPATVR